MRYVRWLLLIILFSANTVFANAITGVRLSVEGQKTRLVLDFATSPPHFQSSESAEEGKIIIDLQNTTFQTRIKHSLFDGSLLRDMQVIPQSGGALRLAFTLRKPARRKLFTLPVKPRLVMDLFADSTIRVDVAPKPRGTTRMRIDVPSRAEMRHGNTRSKNVQTSSASVPKFVEPSRGGSRNIIVVIDPGHGGKDPGAAGAEGTREKKVVLAIARQLYTLINHIPGMRARLTRSGDYYIPLRERLKIARRDKADIFVSIHADAYSESNSRGASVYALSERGASSEAARWLAAKENFSELGGVSLDNKGDMLRSVLLDLSQTATVSASLKIGTYVLAQLQNFTRLHRARVEQAQFVVLKSPDIPSVLVESGFISNRQEEKNLKNPAYQHRIALAICQGIRKYFLYHPPPDTLFAARAEDKHYLLKKYETLRSLAKRFHIDATEVARYNGLKLNDWETGDVVLIPKE